MCTSVNPRVVGILPVPRVVGILPVPRGGMYPVPRVVYVPMVYPRVVYVPYHTFLVYTPLYIPGYMPPWYPGIPTRVYHPVHPPGYTSQPLRVAIPATGDMPETGRPR